MKNCVLHILYIGIATLMLASCTQDELLPMPDANKMQVVFTLALGDSSSRSRATSSWEQNEGGTDSTIGNEIDNEIGLNQLQVVLYKNDGSFLGKVANLQYYQTEQANVYQFVGNLSINTQQQLDCKIMVFANLDEYNVISEDTDLAQLSFPYDSRYIPMWGVSSINVTVKPGERTTLQEPIYLLRAMAKVEVALDEALINEGKYSLDKVALDQYNTRGFSLPRGYETAITTKSLDIEEVFRLNPSNEAKKELLFNANENKTSYSIYIPEYDNTSKGAVPSQMSLIVNGKEYKLDFKDYAAGRPFDIIRNHYYKFNIISVEDGNLTLELKYEVLSWENGGNHGVEFN